MENIIYEQQIDPVTANLARHVYKCRPRTNVTRGLPEWHKAMRDFKIHNSLLNLSNSHHRGGGLHDRYSYHYHCFDNTYAEVVDTLPEHHYHKFYLSPESTRWSLADTMNIENIPYWKYIRLYYVAHVFNWNENATGADRVSFSRREHTFAVWGRDGRVRLAPNAMLSEGKGISLYNRLNGLMGFSYQRTQSDDDQPVFSVESGMLRINRTIKTHRNYSENITSMPVMNGDIIDVKTGEHHSRWLHREKEMPDIMSDIKSSIKLTSQIRSQFTDAPLNPSVRPAIRAEVNQVIPDEVQDIESLDRFLNEGRTIISEKGVFVL